MLLSTLLEEVIETFRNNEIENPVSDAQVIIAHALGMERFRVVTERDLPVGKDQLGKIRRLVKRRLGYEPVAYITGTKEFYSIEFEVNKNVLIPRPETELLVDLALYYAGLNATLLDIGTGSGAIAVAVKHNRKDVSVFATDISEKALRVARKNAVRITGKGSIKFFAGDLFEPVKGMVFDVIVSNPPYVDPGLSGTLQKELSHEPPGALYSGEKGRREIARIIQGLNGHTHTESTVIIEIGSDMKDFIREKGEEAGFEVSVMNDHAGLPRVALLKKREPGG